MGKFQWLRRIKRVVLGEGVTYTVVPSEDSGATLTAGGTAAWASGGTWANILTATLCTEERRILGVQLGKFGTLNYAGGTGTVGNFALDGEVWLATGATGSESVVAKVPISKRMIGGTAGIVLDGTLGYMEVIPPVWLPIPIRVAYGSRVSGRLLVNLASAETANVKVLMGLGM